MKKSNITLKAYYYHEESDSIFIAELGHSSPEFDFIKIGLAINPSTKDLKLKVEKRFPWLIETAKWYKYDTIQKDFWRLPF